MLLFAANATRKPWLIMTNAVESTSNWLMKLETPAVVNVCTQFVWWTLPFGFSYLYSANEGVLLTKSILIFNSGTHSNKHKQQGTKTMWLPQVVVIKIFFEYVHDCDFVVILFD
jgi:hypothetical protein